MVKRQDTQQFTVGQKVVAAVELDGVAAGTAGKVVMVNGLSWIRYRVRFDNGADLGFISADDLTAASRIEQEAFI